MQDAVVVVEQDVVLKGELGLRRSAWMPDHVRPPVTERLGGQPLRKRSGNNVLWIAVQFEDRGVESPVRRGLVPPLLGHPEAGLPARIVIEAVERHVRAAGVEVLGNDVTVGDDHEWR